MLDEKETEKLKVNHFYNVTYYIAREIHYLFNAIN